MDTGHFARKAELIPLSKLLKFCLWEESLLTPTSGDLQTQGPSSKSSNNPSILTITPLHRPSTEGPLLEELRHPTG